MQEEMSWNTLWLLLLNSLVVLSMLSPSVFLDGFISSKDSSTKLSLKLSLKEECWMIFPTDLNTLVLVVPTFLKEGGMILDLKSQFCLILSLMIWRFRLFTRDFSLFSSAVFINWWKSLGRLDYEFYPSKTSIIYYYILTRDKSI